jgi:SAM-dependent methyltransferase
MLTIQRNPRYDRSFGPSVAETVATVYNRAGQAYITYADGDPQSLFSFDGPHAYADRYLWSVLDAKLTALRATGATSIRLLDAGCGPGTWLRRLVTRAIALEFTHITARGFDVAATQIDAARQMARDLVQIPGVDLSYEVGDLTAPLPEADASVDLTLCLYSVLSHLPSDALPAVAVELARVTRGDFIATVRTIGSTPSIFVDSIEKARHFQYDPAQDLCRVELLDGSRFALRFHLFEAGELQRCFTPHFAIEDLRGLDLFHSRFAPDPRWNPDSLPGDRPCRAELAQLEDVYSHTPAFMERAAHLLLVGHPLRVDAARAA